MQSEGGSGWCLMSFGPLSPLAVASCLSYVSTKQPCDVCGACAVAHPRKASPAEGLANRQLETAHLAGQSSSTGRSAAVQRRADIKLPEQLSLWCFFAASERFGVCGTKIKLLCWWLLKPSLLAL